MLFHSHETILLAHLIVYFVNSLFYSMSATMNCHFSKDDRDPTLATVAAMEDLPILARLEFVQSLLLSRGGSRDALPRDMVLVTAEEVLDGVIRVLKKHPRAAKLRWPEP
jgi:hypothetical protein